MHRRTICQAALAMAAMTCYAVGSNAAPVSPVADAFVSVAKPDSNFGGAGQLAASGSADSLPKSEFQALLRFDLAGYKSEFDSAFGVEKWTLQSATLDLTASNPNLTNFNQSAAGQLAVSWMPDDSWIEGTGTPSSNPNPMNGVSWNSKPATGRDQSLGALTFSGATSGTTAYALTLSSGLISDALAGGLTSIRLSEVQALSDVSAFFNSRTAAMGGTPPSLTLQAVAVPEASTLALTGFGLVAYWIQRLRGRQRNGQVA